MHRCCIFVVSLCSAASPRFFFALARSPPPLYLSPSLPIFLIDILGVAYFVVPLCSAAFASFFYSPSLDSFIYDLFILSPPPPSLSLLFLCHAQNDYFKTWTGSTHDIIDTCASTDPGLGITPRLLEAAKRYSFNRCPDFNPDSRRTPSFLSLAFFLRDNPAVEKRAVFTICFKQLVVKGKEMVVHESLFADDATKERFKAWCIKYAPPPSGIIRERVSTVARKVCHFFCLPSTCLFEIDEISRWTW